MTIGMVESRHAKFTKILKVSVNANWPQWDRSVDITKMTHDTTCHNSLRNSPTEKFHGRVPYSLDLPFKNHEKRLETKIKDFDEVWTK